MQVRRAAITLGVLGCLVQAGDSSPARIQFVRPPRIVSEDYPVTYQLRVQKFAEHRRFELAAVDGGLVVSDTSRDMDGEAAPSLVNVTLRLPAGDLTLVGVLFGVGGKELGRATTPVCVRSPVSDLCPSLVTP
jgi:hypothetical protein